MKIIIFTSSYDMQINFRIDFMNKLINNGFEIKIYSDKNIIKENFQSFKHNFSSFSFNFLAFCKDIFKYNRLAKDCDVIFNYTVRNCLIASVLILLKLNTKKNVLFIAGLGRFYNSHSFVSKIIVYLISKASSYNNNKIVVMNERDFNLFHSYGSSPIKINSEGLDLSKFKFIQRKGNLNNIKIVFIGRVIVEKGIYDILKIAEFFSTNKLIQIDIYGDLTDTPNDFLTQVKSFPNINLHGFVSNPSRIIEMSDIIILPSKLNEGLPRIMLESFSIGRICLAYNVVGCSDIYNFTKFKTEFLASNLTSFLYNCNKVISYNDSKYNEIAFELSNSIQAFHDIHVVNSFLFNSLELC